MPSPACCHWERPATCRDNLISMLQIDPEGSAERNTQLEEKITANAARREELFTLYEGVISDEKERRLFEEASPARLLPKMIPAMTNSGRRAIPMPGDRLPTAEADASRSSGRGLRGD